MSTDGTLFRLELNRNETKSKTCISGRHARCTHACSIDRDNSHTDDVVNPDAISSLFIIFIYINTTNKIREKGKAKGEKMGPHARFLPES